MEGCLTRKGVKELTYFAKNLSFSGDYRNIRCKNIEPLILKFNKKFKSLKGEKIYNTVYPNINGKERLEVKFIAWIIPIRKMPIVDMVNYLQERLTPCLEFCDKLERLGYIYSKFLCPPAITEMCRNIGAVPDTTRILFLFYPLSATSPGIREPYYSLEGGCLEESKCDIQSFMNLLIDKK